ncbi:MAG: PAS domain S-box protein [Dehalococcoidia bacterium]|jgi:PAS domain S-box-containing protein
MKDSEKNKGQLIQELERLRARVDQLEKGSMGDREEKESRGAFEERLRAEHEQIEKELKRKSDELQLILDAVPAFIYYKDKDGRIMNMNKATARLATVPKEKLLKKTVFQLMPETADKYHRDDMEVITSGKAKINIEEPLELTDKRRWLKTDKLPIKDESGNVTGLIGFSVDITERKLAEESLRQSEEKLRVMFESMTDGVVVTDLNTTVVDVNKAALNLFGYRKDEVIGRNGFEILSLDKQDKAMQELARSLEGTETTGVQEYILLTRDGRRVDTEISVSKLSDVDGNPFGFVTVVRDVTARKKAEEALRQSEERYRLIAENMSDIIWITDLDLRYQYVSPSIQQVRGFTADEAMKMGAGDYLSEESLALATKRLMEELELEKAGGADPSRVTTMDLKIRKKDGSWMWIEVKVTFLRDNEGKPIGLLGVSRDITDRKRMDESLRTSEEKYRLLFENSIDGKAIVDAETNEILLANKTALKMFGFNSEKDLEGINIFDFIHPDDKDRIAEAARNSAMFKGGSASLGEVRTLTRTGEEKWILVTGILSDYEGKPAGWTSFVDITQRKRAEDALKMSEEKYRDLVEKERDIIFSVDALGFITSINPAVKNWGYSVDEIVGRNFIELIPKDWQERTAIELQNALLASGELTAETRVIHKSGDVLPIEYSAVIIKEGGQYAGAQGIVRDISERKKAEEALRQSEEKFRVLFKSIPDGISVIDLKTGKLVDSNPAALQMFGFDKDDIIGHDAFNLIAEKDRTKAFDDMQNTLIKGRSTMSEWCLLGKGGKEYDCEATAAVINDDTGSPAFMVNVIRDITERKRIEKELDDYRNNLEKMVQERTSDLIKANKDLKREITERKQAEEALRASEARSRAILDAMPDLIFQMSRDGVFIDYKGTAEGLYIPAGQFIGKHIAEVMPSDIADLTVSSIKDALDTGRIQQYSYELRLDGEVRHFDARMAAVGNDLVLVIVRDITESRRMENALKASEEKLRGIFNSIKDGVVLTDLEFNILDANEAAMDLAGGRGKEDFIGTKAYDLLAPEDLDRLMATHSEAREGHPLAKTECKIISKLGEEICVDVGVSMYKDPAGNMAGFVAVLKDITEHKRMEDALRDSEEKLRVMFSSMADGVVVTNLEGKITDLNEAQLRMFGFEDKKEVLGKGGYDFIVEREREKAFKEMVKVFEDGYNIGSVYTVTDNRGKEFECELSTALLHDATGKASGFITVMRDVTERRRMEEALRDSEEKLRFMFKSIIDAVVVVEVNDAGLILTGYSNREELVGVSAFDFITEEDRDRAVTDMMDSFKVGSGFLVQYRFKNKQGDLLFVDARGGMVYNAYGEVTGFIVIVRDISQRRRMEQALKDSEEKLRIIFESIGDGIIVTDMEGIITETNEAAARLGGWSDKGNLVGMSGFDFVAESERGKMVADMIRALQEQRSINVEYVVKDKYEQEYQSEVNVTLLRDAMGSPKGIVSVIRDITERKRMEQDLRDSEELSRGMIESAATAVCIVKDGKFAYVSPMFAEMTGYNIDELVGTKSTDYIHPDDRGSAMREAVANLKGDSAAPHEYRLLRKDGSYIWILEKVASMQYKGERAAIGSLLDITRLKQVEEALRDSEEKLRVIFSSLPDGVTVTDLNGTIIEENEAGVRMSGFSSKEQVIGRNGFDFIAAGDRDRALADFPRIFETGVSSPLEYKMINVGGEEYDGEVIAAIMRDKSGNPQGFITVIRDVTERKKAREELQESQEMMRGMLDSAATGIYLVQDGKFQYVNPLFTGISGYTPEELLESDSMSYIHPDDREIARSKAIENLKGISEQPHEFRFIRKDGQPIWILEKVASIEYKGRRAAIGSFMDITERKRIEEMLQQRSRELEQRTNQLLALQKITTSIQSTLDLKEIMQQVADGVVHNLGFDHALIIKVDEAANVSRGMVFATKYDASKVGDLQEIIGRRLTDIEIPQIRGYSQVVDNAMDGKATITRDFFEVSSTILSREESDAVAGLLGVKTIAVMPLFARDRHVGSILALTDREEIDNVLMEPLRILSDQAGVAVENADLYHGVSEFARRLSVITSLSKILGSSLDIKGVYRAFTEEVRKVMDFDRTSIAMVEGDRLRYFVVAEDIDTQLKAGADLPLSDSATGLVVKTKRTLIEPDFEQEMKFPIDHMYYRSGLRSAIRVPLFSKGEVFATFNLASRNPNAYGEREKEILEQISGSLTAAIENSRLFNQVKQHEAELLKAYEELKSAQAYMVQAEKLRALGEMAGGVAHDFNNILAVVLGRAQLALEDVKDEKLKKDLQIIEQTAMDAATTVRRLQDFARVRVERNFEVLDVKEVVESALQMAESRRAKLKEREGINIDIEMKLGELAPVEGDAAELREGLLNIIFNAMDAMPEGGKITLHATQTKKWLTLAISDTGIGMPEEIRKKIFEPFFTTRTHKGTGLGLSVTYGIIQRHRGEIWVEGNEGAGSTFKIKLPVCEGVVTKKATPGKPDAMRSISILMVDDNPEVAGVLGLTLKKLGHSVTEANSGEAAINTFEVGSFDMVITDLGMPDMSGHEVAKIVKEIKPGTPVLVISGWGGQLNLDDMPEVDGVIAKPFSKDTLSEKISALMSGEKARSVKTECKAPKTRKSGKDNSNRGKSAEKAAGDGKTEGKKRLKQKKSDS